MECYVSLFFKSPNNPGDFEVFISPPYPADTVDDVNFALLHYKKTICEAYPSLKYIGLDFNIF